MTRERAYCRSLTLSIGRSASRLSGMFLGHVSKRFKLPSNSRRPEALAETVAELGPGAMAGTRNDAVNTDLRNWVGAKKIVEAVRWKDNG
jgi:hypothetical protein